MPGNRKSTLRVEAEVEQGHAKQTAFGPERMWYNGGAMDITGLNHTQVAGPARLAVAESR